MGVQLTLIIYIFVPPPVNIFVITQIIFALVILATIISMYSAVDYTRKNIGVFGEKAVNN